MYNNDTEVLFPIRVIPALISLRGTEWQELITRITKENSDENEISAFILLMVRLGGCINCNTDSYRAMRGCTQCAKQTIKRFRGSDQELLESFDQSKREIETFIGQYKVGK